MWLLPIYKHFKDQHLASTKNQARKNYRRPGYKGLKNSFYSNLMMMSKFYNLPDSDPIFLTDAKFKHYANLMQQK